MTTASELQANKDLAVGWLLNLNQGRIEAMLATTADDWQMHGGPPELPDRSRRDPRPDRRTSARSTRPGPSST